MICSRKTVLGYFMLAFDIATGATSSIAVQALQRAVPDFQLSALRYIGCIVVSILWMCKEKPSLHLEKVQYVYIIALGAAGIGFNVCFFSAVSMLPLTNASAVTISFRMVFFALLTGVKSWVPIDKILIISIVGCMSGMFFIAQPWSHFLEGFTPEFLGPSAQNNTLIELNFSVNGPQNLSSLSLLVTTSNKKSPYQTLILGYLLALLAAFADSIYFVVVSVYLTSVNPAVQCFASACISFPISMLISLYVEQPILIAGTKDILLVSIHVLATGICLITQTAALQLLNPIKVSVVENIEILLYILPQNTFVSHYLYGRKNALEVFGCIMIAIFAGFSSFSFSSHYHEDF